MERENLSLRCKGRCKGRRPSGSNRKDQSTDAGHRGGAARRREEGSVMELDQRGCSVPPRPRANREREELCGQGKAVFHPEAGRLGRFPEGEGQPGSGWCRRADDWWVLGGSCQHPLPALESHVLRELLSSTGAAG